MGVPSYLLKKHDTYYFRQACCQFLKSKIGKRELVRSLGVKEKSIAVRMAREIKVNLDYVIDHLASDEFTESVHVEQFFDDCVLKIKDKYIYSKVGTLPFSCSEPTFQQHPTLHSQGVVTSAPPITSPETSIEPFF